MFSEEDKLASKLKINMRSYKEKVEKSLLPHYGEIQQILRVENERLSNDPKTNEGDMALIRTQITDITEKMEKEKKEMANSMSDIYETWRQIKNLRKSQGYSSTAIELGVQEFIS